jgi:hypothetical protein
VLPKLRLIERLALDEQRANWTPLFLLLDQHTSHLIVRHVAKRDGCLAEFPLVEKLVIEQAEQLSGVQVPTLHGDAAESFYPCFLLVESRKDVFRPECADVDEVLSEEHGRSGVRAARAGKNLRPGR